MNDPNDGIRRHRIHVSRVRAVRESLDVLLDTDLPYTSVIPARLIRQRRIAFDMLDFQEYRDWIEQVDVGMLSAHEIRAHIRLWDALARLDVTLVDDAMDFKDELDLYRTGSMRDDIPDLLLQPEPDQ